MLVYLLHSPGGTWDIKFCILPDLKAVCSFHDRRLVSS
jgi:hypothetical protein